jgi:hypothetical protein
MSKSFYTTFGIVLVVSLFIVGGLWGVVLGLWLLTAVVLKVIFCLLAILPLWWVRRVVKRDISTPSGALNVAMDWWVMTYAILCVVLTIAPVSAAFSSPALDESLVWLQYVVAALVTLPIGFVVYKTRHHY